MLRCQSSVVSLGIVNDASVLKRFVSSACWQALLRVRLRWEGSEKPTRIWRRTALEVDRPLPAVVLLLELLRLLVRMSLCCSCVVLNAARFVDHRKQEFGCLGSSSRPSVGLRLCLCVSVDTAPLSSPPSLSISISLVRSRFGARNRGQSAVSCPHSAVALRACRRRSQYAFWCFRGLWVWRVLVPVIEITAVFVRLRLRLRQRRPPATPASGARPPVAIFRILGPGNLVISDVIL